jgi:hypothetical protein
VKYHDPGLHLIQTPEVTSRHDLLLQTLPVERLLCPMD